MLNLVSKLFLPCLALVASVSTSFAVPVSYNTTGSVFTCNGVGAGTNASPTCVASAAVGGVSTVQFTSGSNSATLSYFDYTTAAAVNPNPSVNSQFGDFSWTGNTSVLLGVNSGSNLADFTLMITQALPTPGGMGTLNSDLKGNIKLVSPDGGMRLLFGGGFITIGGVVYTPDNTTINSNLSPIKTTLNGIITAPVPEPGFYGLLSLGMAGLYAAVRRRRNATV